MKENFFQRKVIGKSHALGSYKPGALGSFLVIVIGVIEKTVKTYSVASFKVGFPKWCAR